MKRRGFSLLEVLLAIAILGTALASISILIRLGARGAVHSRELTTAQLLCEAKLAEITSGMLPADPGGPWQFDLPEHAEWVYYVDLQPLPQPGLMSMTVTVAQNLGPTSTQKPLTFELVRWIQDPGLELGDPMDPTDPASGMTSPAITGGASGP